MFREDRMRIDLLATGIPEPPCWALMGAGLGQPKGRRPYADRRSPMTARVVPME
jgi:hypothetical protein